MNKLIKFSFLILILTSCSKNDKNANFNPEAIKLNDIAVELGNLHKYDSAILVFDKAIDLDSTYYLAYGNKAAVYSAMKQYAKALFEVERQVEVKPDFAEGWISAATLSDKIGDSIKAKIYYQKSLDLYEQRITDPTRKPYLIESRINKDFLLIQLGKEEEAKKDLEIIKKDYPEIKTVDAFLKMTRKSFLLSLEEKKK